MDEFNANLLSVDVEDEERLCFGDTDFGLLAVVRGFMGEEEDEDGIRLA